MLEEVIALIINEDECWEVFYADLPYSFHTQFWIFYTFDALDVLLSKEGCRTTDRTKIEATMLLASICYLL